jgi:hypothetical protein
VVDRLRVFWNRPLRDTDRPRLFALAIALIVAAAVLLTQLERPAAQPRPERTPRLPASASPVPEAPLAAATAEPSEEGTRTPVAPAPTDVAASKRAARRFLAGYLPYTYGRGRPRRISSATLALRRRLAAQRPRVPARERRRRPRVALLQSNAVGSRRAELVALVEDGRRRYSVPLELVRTTTGWRVARVGS